MFGPERNRKHVSCIVWTDPVHFGDFCCLLRFCAFWALRRLCGMIQVQLQPKLLVPGTFHCTHLTPRRRSLCPRLAPHADNAPRPPSKGANDCETNGSRESTCNETILGNASDAKQHHFKTCVNAWAGVHLFLDHAEAALPYFRMLFLNPHKIN